MSKYSNWRTSGGPLQQRLLGLIDREDFGGLTAQEARAHFNTSNPSDDRYVHHGWISGALAILHRDNQIARLKEKRDGYKVYVQPDFLAGRDCEAQGRGGPSKEEIEYNASVTGLLEYWLQVDTEGTRFGTDRTKAERNQRLFFSELKALWLERPQ